MNSVRVLVALAMVSAVSPSVRAAAQDAPSAAVEAEVPTAPVTLDGVELFRLRGVSAYPAEERAKQTESRIRDLAADRAIPTASIRIEERGAVSRIVAGDRLLTVVVDADAALEGIARPELAQVHVQRLHQAIDRYREARASSALWRSAGRTAIATLVLALAIAVFAWSWRWIDRNLRRRIHDRVHSVGIQSFEVVRADRIRTALVHLFIALRVLVMFTLALTYLGYAFAQWPWTAQLSNGMTDFALAPIGTLGMGLVANMPRLVFLAVLYYIIRLALRLIRLFFESVESGGVTLQGFEREWAMPTYNMIRVAVVAFGLVVAYPYIPGSQSEAFKGVSLFIGIVFSLGSSTAISNTIAGYMLIYRRAFKVGDRVKIRETIGEVLETRLQVTHVRSMKNEEIIIPNSEILSNEVLNYTSLSLERGLILHTEVGIGYETPWRQVEAMLLAAAQRTPGLGTKPPPYVLIKRLADFAVTYELNVPCGDVTKMQATYTALHQSVLDVFNEHGVQIMTPAYEGDPEIPKIVAPKDWYMAPAAPPGEPST